jgi:adenosine deaminase
MEELERERGPMVEPCPINDYKPSKSQALQEYEIKIKFLSRGCIVSVGCKEIAFENVSEALGAFNLYVTSPYEEQQKWRKVLE